MHSVCVAVCCNVACTFLKLENPFFIVVAKNILMRSDVVVNSD